MKKLNITKEQFEKSKYFNNKYGKLEYVSESGKLFKTEKGKIVKFLKESCDEEFDRYYERMKKIFRYDSGIHIRLRDNEDVSETIEVTFDDRFNWNDDVVSGRIPLDEDSGLLDWITRFDEQAHRNGWEFDYDIAKDIESPIDGGANNDYLAMLTLTCKCDKEEVEDDKLFESSVGEGETETLVKVNDLVSKAYASLYDELKKAGIDFDSASDDGFYVNDPDAQKTYFINLYVNECKEYEGSYRADESKKTVSESNWNFGSSKQDQELKARKDAATDKIREYEGQDLTKIGKPIEDITTYNNEYFELPNGIVVLLKNDDDGFNQVFVVDDDGHEENVGAQYDDDGLMLGCYY